MNHEELAELIRKHGATEMADMVMTGVGKWVEHGWDLTRWVAKAVPGAILFYRVRGGITTAETRLLVVNAVEEDRTRWQAIADEADDPTELLLVGVGW